jgi:CDP-glucose 4,6-dehydratase
MESVVMNRTFWLGKKVLVTGHTGFKGSWLCLWLKSLGADVIGFALAPSTKPSLFEAAQLSKHVHHNEDDINDSASVLKCFQTHKPDVVFHLAAQALVRPSYEEPLETFQTNIMGAANVLDAALRTPSAKCVVNITSDKCYEPSLSPNGHQEGDPMGGHDPYSASKGCAELVTQAYGRSFFAAKGKGLASARAGNVIGGGDWSGDRLIPDIVKQFHNNQSVYIRSPHAVRPWQHVLEPLAGYLILAQRLFEEAETYSTGWNFGPDLDDTREVQWVVEQMVSLWGEDASWEADAGPHPHENPCLRLDSSRARNQLQWKPRLELREALEWTTSWYQAFYREPEKARELCESQIRSFTERALP